jgi:hypothetical protein
MAIGVKGRFIGERELAHVLIAPRRYTVPDEVTVQDSADHNNVGAEASLKFVDDRSIDHEVFRSRSGWTRPARGAGREEAQSKRDRVPAVAARFQGSHRRRLTNLLTCPAPASTNDSPMPSVRE